MAEEATTAEQALPSVTHASNSTEGIELTAAGCFTNISTQAGSGEIRWTVSEKGSTGCILHLQVPQQLYIQARMQLNGHKTCWEFTKLSEGPATVKIVEVFDGRDLQEVVGDMQCKRSPHYQAMFSSTNHLAFYMGVRADITIRFTVTLQFLKNTLPAVMTSETAGYVTSPGFDGLCFSPPSVAAARTLTVPPGFDAVMFSFERLALENDEYCARSHLQLTYTAGNSSIIRTRLCYQHSQSAEVVETDSLSLLYEVGINVGTNAGFKMLFSFHHHAALPRKNGHGLFNCSVAFYPTFQIHLYCNMLTECDDGRDETGRCPFSSEACQGKLASGAKCFFVAFLASGERPATINPGIDPSQLAVECSKQGGDLAVIQTQKELDDVYRLLSGGKVGDHCGSYHTGLVYGHRSTPNMYRQLWVGRDKTVIYSYFVHPLFKGLVTSTVFNGQEQCQTMGPLHVFSRSVTQSCTQYGVCGAVCQTFTKHPTSQTAISLPNLPTHNVSSNNIRIIVQTRNAASVNNSAPTSHAAQTARQILLNLGVCPGKHVTHVFLTCDRKSDCGENQRVVHKCAFPWAVLSSPQPSDSNGTGFTQPENHHRQFRTLEDERGGNPRFEQFVHMFFCDDGAETVHYSLVCDLRPDCSDLSDESFCQHKPCEQFTCSNQQCVSFSNICDGITDCILGNSDEEFCEQGVAYYSVR